MKCTYFLIAFLVSFACLSFSNQSISQASQEPGTKKPVAKKVIVNNKGKKTIAGTHANPKPVSKVAKTNNLKSNPVSKSPAKTKNATPSPAVTNQITQTVSEKAPVPTKREQDMINEINSLRTNPSGYVNNIINYLDKNKADKNVRKAATEAIILLKKMAPLNALSLNPVMYNDAKQFGMSMANSNNLKHSNLPYAENLSLGFENIRDAIIDLLIDSDDPDRGHRTNLLNAHLKYVAVFELPGMVQDIPYCYVQEFK